MILTRLETFENAPKCVFNFTHFSNGFSTKPTFLTRLHDHNHQKRQENKAKMNSAKDHFLGRFQPFKMTLGCPEIRDSEMPIKSTKFQQFASF